jgi:chorismate mutase/prephenate dehydratase
MEKSLNDLRNEIDSVDSKPLELLELRMRIIEQVGELKGVTGKPVRDLKREEELIHCLMRKCDDPFLARKISGIWSTIMEVSREKQESLLLKQ